MGRNQLLRTPGNGGWLFVIGFVFFCVVYEYGRVLNSPPFPHHLDRQTVGLSMAYNYWEKGTELMDPQVHHLFADDLTSGRTVAELPILYYTVAQLWRITGPNAFVYRLFMLLLHFAGSYALFLTFRRFLADSGWAVLASLFFFTSPAIVYFAIGFMPDVPAYDLVLLGFYALVRRWPEERKDDMVFSAVLFALAALLKITALMVPLTLLVLGSVEVAVPNVFAKAGGFFRNRRLLIGLLLGVLVLVFTWYAWSDAFNEKHGALFSHSGTWALWDLPTSDVEHAWKVGREVTVFQLFDTPAWILLGGMLVFLFAHFRMVPLGGWLAFFTLFFGTVLYTLLWFITLDGHEYYFIHPMVLPILVVGLFLHTLKQCYPNVFNSNYTKVVFMLFVGYHCAYASNNHLMRTRGLGALEVERHQLLAHPGELVYWDMVQYWTITPTLTIEAYNRSLGIRKEDRVLCFTDRSVCGSLYLMGQRGWTLFGVAQVDTTVLNARIRNGARYLFLYDGEWPNSPELAPYVEHRIGTYQGLMIYDLRNLDNVP